MQKVLCTEIHRTQHFLGKNGVFGNLFLDIEGEAQIFQFAQGGLQAVLAAIDGDGLVGQRDFKLQLGLGQGRGDALDAVFTHHVGNRNLEHRIKSFLLFG